MKHWNTEEMKTVLAAACPGKRIATSERGGDCDTNSVRVVLDGVSEDGWGEFVTLCGFNTDYDRHPITDPDNVDVEMLELTCHSGNGLDGATPDECIAYGNIMAALRRQGWNVVPYMKNYF